MAASPGASAPRVEVQAQVDDRETAAKIGVGAAAGALVGQILGKDTESTLKGAGVGAAVGTAVAFTRMLTPWPNQETPGLEVASAGEIEHR